MKKYQALIAFAVLSLTWAHADLPLRHVTLFNSGVGYFERQGIVHGDELVELQFQKEQINDVIKSLVVIDRDGGSVSAVTYDAPDPLERTLRSFAVNLADNPSIAQLLDRMRGAPVRVKASARDHQGRILGVEHHHRREGDTELTVSVLNLHTDQGLRPVRLDEVQELEVLDPAIAQDFRAALSVLAAQMDQTRKAVRLQFAGEGERRIRAAYMLETPVWKTSYRLVLNDDELLLQGWAHVANMTDDDWDDVHVSLVSGRPISFIQNLYDPIYVKRPEVKMELFDGITPQEYARRVDAMQVDSPLTMRGLYSARAAPGRARMLGADARMDFELQAPAAVGEEAGELFQYVVADPVSIPRQSSAMLPIVQTTVEGKPLSIYNENVHKRHPLNGLEMKNTSDVYLMQGPVTVFEGGIYAGDARLPDTRMGESRLLSYAVDLATDVSAEWLSGPREIVQMRIVHNSLFAQREHQQTTTYQIRNVRDRDRLLILEHPYTPGWDLIMPEEEPERTSDVYRFRVPLTANESKEFSVTTRQVQEQEISLSTLRPSRIEFYLRQTDALTPELRDALRELAARQQELADLTRRREGLETNIAEITKEQERIRQNMAVVQRPSESFSMWERKLIEQERELERLNSELREVREAELDKTRQLNDWLAQLTVE